MSPTAIPPRWRAGRDRGDQPHRRRAKAEARGPNDPGGRVRGRSGRDSSPYDQSGFTLLEVLVALIVLVVAVVAVLELLGQGLRLAGLSREHVAATLLAGAKLSEIATGPLEEETIEGQEGGFRWTRRVTFDPTLLPESRAPRDSDTVHLARVSVEVRWGRDRRVELTTLRTWATKP